MIDILYMIQMMFHNQLLKDTNIHHTRTGNVGIPGMDKSTGYMTKKFKHQILINSLHLI